VSALAVALPAHLDFSSPDVMRDGFLMREAIERRLQRRIRITVVAVVPA
jgi:hypothetical protein